MSDNENLKEATPQSYIKCSPMAGNIDLLDILKMVVQQKWVIIWISALFLGVGISVIILMPNIYRVEVVILPPSAESVEKLNVPNFEGDFGEYFFKVDAADIYHDLINNVQSNKLQRQFFDDNGLINHLARQKDSRAESLVFKEEFREKLIVKGKDVFVNISLEGSDPEQLSQWLDNYVRLADEYTVKTQIQSFEMKAQRVRDSLSERIASLRSVEKSRRLDLIARLEEAVAVADTLGIVEHNNKLGFQNEVAQVNTVNMSFNLQEVPLYLKGAKALGAEIEILKKRKNDDPFIPELRSLQEQLNFLTSVKQYPDNVHAMRVDQLAVANDKPIKPKKVLILAFSLIFGLLGAFSTAFLRYILVKNNSQN